MSVGMGHLSAITRNFPTSNPLTPICLLEELDDMLERELPLSVLVASVGG